MTSNIDIELYYQQARELSVESWKTDRWKQFEVHALEAVRGKWDKLVFWLEQQEERLHQTWEEASVTGTAEVVLEEALHAWLEALDEIRRLALNHKFEYDLFELAEDAQRLICLAMTLEDEPVEGPVEEEAEPLVKSAFLKAFAA